MFRFGASARSAARLARPDEVARLGRDPLSLHDEGPLQVRSATVHKARADDGVALSSSAKAFRKASRCRGWIGAAAASTAHRGPGASGRKARAEQHRALPGVKMPASNAWQQGGPETWSISGPPGASLSAGGPRRLDRSLEDAKQPACSVEPIKHL